MAVTASLVQTTAWQLLRWGWTVFVRKHKLLEECCHCLQQCKSRSVLVTVIQSLVHALVVKVTLYLLSCGGSWTMQIISRQETSGLLNLDLSGFPGITK